MFNDPHPRVRWAACQCLYVLPKYSFPTVFVATEVWTATLVDNCAQILRYVNYLYGILSHNLPRNTGGHPGPFPSGDVLRSNPCVASARTQVRGWSTARILWTNATLGYMLMRHRHSSTFAKASRDKSCFLILTLLFSGFSPCSNPVVQVGSRSKLSQPWRWLLTLVRIHSAQYVVISPVSIRQCIWHWAVLLIHYAIDDECPPQCSRGWAPKTEVQGYGMCRTYRY